MRGRAVIRAVDQGGRTVLVDLEATAPLALFPTTPRGGPGGAEVTIVESAAAALADDLIDIDIDVGPSAELTLRAVGATVALAGQGVGSVVTVHARVHGRGTLRWEAEPLIVTARADHRFDSHLELGPGASVAWRETVVLGRLGEQPGRCRLTLRADQDGRPLLRHHLAVGDLSRAWEGPIGLGSHRQIATTLLTGGFVSVVAPRPPSADSAVLHLEGAGLLVTDLGPPIGYGAPRADLEDTDVSGMSRPWSRR